MSDILNHEKAIYHLEKQVEDLSKKLNALIRALGKTNNDFVAELYDEYRVEMGLKRKYKVRDGDFGDDAYERNA